jgi:thiopeptide-type bacteriocin biosynthesis protein
LPVGALPRAARALAAHPLGADAVALASPSLAAARPGAARDRALARYGRRAAFRATPSGLLAGVCVGRLGPRTDVATGTPVPVLSPTWARLDALARALLDDPGVRHRVRVRCAPSLLRAPGVVSWIGPPAGRPEAFHEAFDETREAELDERPAAVVDAAAHWTDWLAVRRAARLYDEDDLDLDDLLLSLVDDGLLQTDLAPPLVGPPPARQLLARLRALGLDETVTALDQAIAALESGDVAAARGALRALPGSAGPDVHAVLVHQPARPPTLARAAVARAARLTPLLLGLQEALAPPVSERLGSAAVADALDAVTETFGAGAFDLEALATGGYGVDLAGDDDAPTRPADPAVVAFLADAFARAAADGAPEVTLESPALAALLRDRAPLPSPDSAELFLVPAPARPGAPAGSGWLLGLHGPAGASLGRFAHALGDELARSLDEIAQAEGQLTPAQERLDVAFAPSAELADLCTHPRNRRRSLAISRWSGEDDLTLADLAVVADPERPDALALRPRHQPAGATVLPAPLWRVRSATAPAGAARLAVGWSLQRQQAPWAFSPGPLAALEHLPRVTLDGFVIAPASWRVPAPLGTGRGGPAALARWRRARGVPRHVQLGQGDELLPLDLDAPGAARELAGADRVHEIWPTLNAVVDRDGRRLEVIVPIVREPANPLTAHPDGLDLARVPPPREAPPLDGWRTFKLFGPRDAQDGLLLDVVRPTLHEATAAREIDGWFFLRYEDGPGRRPHLRLRAHAGDPAGFEARLRRALAPARDAGALTSLEITDYFPERGRFRPAELGALHAIFQADGEAVLALLERADEHPGVMRARLFDALAGGLGYDGAAREALARERRTGAERSLPGDAESRREIDAAFRAHSRALRAALAGDQAATTDLGEAMQSLRERVASAAAELTSERRPVLLRILLHLCSVRLAGADPDGERLGYIFWQRALEGLRRAPGGAR